MFVSSIYAHHARAMEPALPTGLDAPEEVGALKPEQKSNDLKRAAGSTFGSRGLTLTGSLDMRTGVRTQEDKHVDQHSLAETRVQFNLELSGEPLEFRLSTDLLYDAVAGPKEIDLEEGSGFLDLRETSVLFRPASFIDIKAGRQILTWGTGDFVFINDLFPKDFKSFFIGRDVQYLKAPSDAVKLTLFSQVANLDLVYTPRFDADRYIDGSRLSFFNQTLDNLSGKNDVVSADKPDDSFSDDEIALRLYQNLSGYELSLYAYRGFWKSPAGTNESAGKVTFPKLDVYGASLRGSVGGGIANIEFGYYNSLDDPKGDDFAIRNSQARFLVGYERELIKELNLGVQYYLEQRLDHSAYQRTLPENQRMANEIRHVVSLRLTQLLKRQYLKLSLFTFYSPFDQDAYLRPEITYQLYDGWSIKTGGNWFFGNIEQSFFGQLQRNSNIYLGFRYSF